MKETKLALYGAPIGDYFGGIYEVIQPHKLPTLRTLKEFKSCFSDDTFMTCAVADAILKGPKDLSAQAISSMQSIGRKHHGGYGAGFYRWILSDDPKPYGSFGNGACMRVSPAGLSATTEKEAEKQATKVTQVSHNHPIAIKFAKIVAKLVFHAKEDITKEQMWELLKSYDEVIYEEVKSLDLEALHKTYGYDPTCRGSVPQALYCFLSSTSFEDCVGRVCYIGGDSDTIGAIACSIAAPFYGDEQVKPFVEALPELPEDLGEIIKVFSYEYL